MSDPSPIPLDYATPPPRPRRRIGIFITFLILMFLAGVCLPLLFLAKQARFHAVGTATIPISSGPLVLPIDPPTVPSQVKIVQRGAEPLPGTNGSVIALIDDYSRVHVVLRITAHKRTLANRSMHLGDVQDFTVAGQSFEIELVELQNRPTGIGTSTGDDYCVFNIRLAAPKSPAKQAAP